MIGAETLIGLGASAIIAAAIIVYLALRGSDHKVMLVRMSAAIAIGLVAIAVAWERPGAAAVWLAVAWMLWP